jgi:hypothetical protein
MDGMNGKPSQKSCSSHPSAKTNRSETHPLTDRNDPIMKKQFMILLTALLAGSTWAAADQSKHSPTTKYPSYNGLVMAGYQGWFRAQNGEMYRNPASIRIDMWPDVSEYEKKTYPTGLKLADGTTARFFSSTDKYLDGKLVLKGGSKEDHQAAHEWISMFLNDAVARESPSHYKS